MSLTKTFGINQILTAEDVNTHMVHQVPNPGDPYDTGWIPLTPLNGFTLVDMAAARRIGMVIYFRGRLHGTLPGATTFDVAQSPFKISAQFATSAATSGGLTNVYLYMGSTGIIRLRNPTELTTNFWLHELSGALVE